MALEDSVDVGDASVLDCAPDWTLNEIQEVMIQPKSDENSDGKLQDCVKGHTPNSSTHWQEIEPRHQISFPDLRSHFLK